MNRGHEGTDIFYGNKNKSQFLDYLADATTKMKIKIFAYCVMDTHYHLVLENSNGKMSEFMKRLNGQYGSYYRMVSGGKGYVFQVDALLDCPLFLTIPFSLLQRKSDLAAANLAVQVC